MANRILKGLAVVAGTGLAMGYTAGRARVLPVRRRSASLAGPAPPPSIDLSASAPEPPELPDEEEFLNIEPLLDRLERVESRIESMERKPAAAPVASASGLNGAAALLSDLDRRVEENTRELALLRERVSAAERQVAESLAAVRRGVDEAREEIPSLVERSVAARMEDLRSRFAAEIEQSHQRTLATFERAIDEKISVRIGAIERALADQAGSIDVLRLRTTETDNNLQRLVAAIEKLCERAQFIPPEAPPRPAAYETRSPFESQLHEALRREPVTPVIVNEDSGAAAASAVDARAVEVQVPAPAFTGGAAPKKSRFLFRNLIVAAFGLLAARFLR